MRHFFWVLLLMAGWSPSSLQAQETGLDFLRIGVSAAANAMGDAHTAVTRDAFSTFTNPAGLVAATTNMATLSYHEWVGGLSTYHVASRFSMGSRGALGIAVLATDSGDLEARDQPGEPTGTFGAQYISAGLGYGRQVGPLRLGATVKYLRESIQDVYASGYAVDAGVQMDLADRSIILGAALQNTGAMSRLEREATPLPQTLRAGMALYPLQVLAMADNTRLLDVMVVGEISHLFPSNITRIHAGMAATVLEMLIVRAGYLSQDDLRNFTFGLGLDYAPFIIDYAFVPFESGFEGPGHVLTLLYLW